MDTKSKILDQYQVIINCRSRDSISPSLLQSLKAQTLSCPVRILESRQFPKRLSLIDNANTIYFFFDEDIALPNPDYLQRVIQLFHSQSDLLFLAGAYISRKKAPYLTRCYNSLIQHWMMIGSERNGALPICYNAPGGIWIVSGKIKEFLVGWEEPEFWAGEDTYSLRWLQNRGVSFHHSPLANVIHGSRSHILHFLKRAFLQGQSRTRFSLRHPQRKVVWPVLWTHLPYWPGWLAHQLCVELGALYNFTLSVIARKIP